MILAGSVVNAAVVFLCAILGMVFRKGIPARFQTILTSALGASIICMGVQAVLETQHMLVMILSLVAGALLGEWINIDLYLAKSGAWLQRKFKNQDKIAEGFVVSTLLFCVGSMAIMGAIQSGTQNNHTILFTKTVLDGVMAIVFASAYGVGVVFSAIPVLIYESALILAADGLSAYLDPMVLNEISATGGILLVLLGFNLLNLKEEKFKVANLLPALFFPLLMPLFL
ncbi:MAG: DUF554 domain-containing protein [Fastidiosipilaceae bacterium]|jgi:uncharacterized membrane protein YqgA involved in biofilm formation